MKELELFIEEMEQDLFNPSNIRKTRNNLNNHEKIALKEKKSWDDKVIGVQDKGSRYVFLPNNDYESKVQIRLSVAHLRKQPLTIMRTLKKNLIRNCTLKEVIDNNWKRFINPTNSNPGKMYGLVKTHKVNNPVRLITSGCSTPILIYRTCFI